MKNSKQSTVTKISVTPKSEMTHEARILDALCADELECLFQEKEPGLITVLGKFRVTPMLYQLVAAQLEGIDQNLMVNVEYTAAELMGDEVWSTFGPKGQREMVLCLKQFALNERCALIDTGTGTFVYA